MASIRRQGSRWEIRECRSTPKGPRQHRLASFRGALTPEILEEAEWAAQRPFDRTALIARARALGIPVSPQRRQDDARRLAGRLARGEPLDATLVGLLRSLLADRPVAELPEHLADVRDWLGASEAERGRTLRGLLRTADLILGSRSALRTRPRRAFPRFSSREPEPA